MSEELRETFRAMREEKQARHKKWHVDNRVYMDKHCPYKYIDKGETLLFRELDKVKADFYPSTGRWRICGSDSKGTFSGGAKRFLEWYEKQTCEVIK